jgi:hypothetical protein
VLAREPFRVFLDKSQQPRSGRDGAKHLPIRNHLQYLKGADILTTTTLLSLSLNKISINTG